MAVALDASSPIRFTGTPIAGGSITSASFTAPTDAILAVAVQYDGASVAAVGTVSASDTGGLSWSGVERDAGEGSGGGGAALYWARTPSSGSRTVSITRTGGSGGATRFSATCYVYTGADVNGTPVDSITANNEGGSTTNSISTTSVTPTGNGALVVSGTDWSASGACTSSDLLGLDSVVGSGHAEYAGAIDVIDGWKACNEAVGVTGNLDAFGAGAVTWKWVQIVIIEAPTAADALGTRDEFAITQRQG